MTSGQRIAELSRAAEALIAGPPEYLRAFVGEEGGARQQRRAIVIASLREQETEGRVGVSVDEIAADLDAVLRWRGQDIPGDLRSEVVEVLRQLEGWQAVDGGLAPERAERDGLRRRVERDYALARSLRVFLPHWDEVQRALRRRYVSLSANYFAQAITALDTLLEELQYEDTDPLRCHTAWHSLRQALHGIITESRDFARELRSLRVDGNHPEVLADIADRLGILHEKFFRVAAEGAAQVRERLEKLRDERHDGENVHRLQEALRVREEEWSVGLGETPEEQRDRLQSVQFEVLRELVIFERLMAESGPGSWREGAKAISLALVDLTERIHSAISLRLQQTQAITALLRRAGDLAEGGENATQRARQYLWNASGSMHAAIWVQARPPSDDQVRLDRWLALRGGSPLPLVDEDIWKKSLRPRHRPALPPPPSSLELPEDWDPGEDPRVRQLEEARAHLVERLIATGSASALGYLESLDELRLLASFLWLPRDSAPLRRLGLRIQSPGAGVSARTTLHGPGFVVELDNYRFLATTRSRQAEVDAARAARESETRHWTRTEREIPWPVASVVSRPVSGAPPTPPLLAPAMVTSNLPPVESGLAFTKRSLGPIQFDVGRPTIPLEGTTQAPEEAHPSSLMSTRGPQPAQAASDIPRPANEEEPQQPGRRFWPFQLGRRNVPNAQS
ncbi:MAG: hypothetical protein ACLQUY_26515 [Ktedonobacterales bacterium]